MYMLTSILKNASYIQVAYIPPGRYCPMQVILSRAVKYLIKVLSDKNNLIQFIVSKISPNIGSGKQQNINFLSNLDSVTFAIHFWLVKWSLY